MSLMVLAAPGLLLRRRVARGAYLLVVMTVWAVVVGAGMERSYYRRARKKASLRDAAEGLDSGTSRAYAKHLGLQLLSEISGAESRRGQPFGLVVVYLRSKAVGHGAAECEQKIVDLVFNQAPQATVVKFDLLTWVLHVPASAGSSSQDPTALVSRAIGASYPEGPLLVVSVTPQPGETIGSMVRRARSS